MTSQSVKSSGGNDSAAPGMTGDVYWPTQDVVQQANVPDWEATARRAIKDLPGFWEEQARELHWYGLLGAVLDETQKPFYKWFTGARVNIVDNCLDRYQNTPTRNKTALIWEGENGDARELSYATLHREVSRFANVLKGLGILRTGKGGQLYMTDKNEYLAVVEQRFKAADPDQDGTLDAKELKAPAGRALLRLMLK